MDHTYVEVGDRGVFVNDGHLTLLCHFIEGEGRRLLIERNADAIVRQSFEQFLAGFVDYGPGVFLVDFRPMLGQTEFLFGVFDRVASRLRCFDGAIPLVYLEEHVNTPVVHWVADADTAPVLRALRRVWGLFSELGPGPA
jgi:hypothetical protein